MTDDPMLSTVVVVDERSFEVTASRRTSRSMLLSVVVDGRDQWSFEVAGWRPWSCGVGSGEFYLWSARQLIVFPKPSCDPVELGLDEDLLLVFRRSLGWVVVCETSVRLLAEQEEVARIEFGEVIEAATWKRGHLVVRDASGSERSVRVDAGGLQAEPID